MPPRRPHGTTREGRNQIIFPAVVAVGTAKLGRFLRCRGPPCLGVASRVHLPGPGAASALWRYIARCFPSVAGSAVKRSCQAARAMRVCPGVAATAQQGRLAPAEHGGTCRRFDGVAGVWCVTSQSASVAEADGCL
jgi:hypothetical protein